jgi:hypothetical protein
MKKIEVKSESVETEFETVVKRDRTAADYADAVPVSTDEIEYYG